MALNGTYRVTTRSSMGIADADFIFQTEGDVLTGKVTVMGMEADIQNGKASDKEFSGVVEADSPMGRMKMNLTGAIDGDKIKGVMKAKMGGATFEGGKIL